jgi:hypothetical protein
MKPMYESGVKSEMEDEVSGYVSALSAQLKHEFCETQWIVWPPYVGAISCLILLRYTLHQPSRPQVIRGGIEQRCSLLH